MTVTCVYARGLGSFFRAGDFPREEIRGSLVCRSVCLCSGTDGSFLRASWHSQVGPDATWGFAKGSGLMQGHQRQGDKGLEGS
ncbi:hypothetical protein PAL_GLEAN10020128 [Pteropus alecto]|uniref:Uncharacterized protein n=1 Tax=Pteropus alecto TaxID=9402 RepID=L5KRX9_PTEAL|nr:hypothetical protein PAL_GLEAN10020128 [Pteropus alecto]